MRNIMTYKGYAGTVEYSDADGILFGRIAGIDDVISYEGQSVRELREAFQGVVDDYLTHCRNTGKTPNRPYSGKLTPRLDPALHAKLAAQVQAKKILRDAW